MAASLTSSPEILVLPSIDALVTPDERVLDAELAMNAIRREVTTVEKLVGELDVIVGSADRTPADLTHQGHTVALTLADELTHLADRMRTIGGQLAFEVGDSDWVAAFSLRCRAGSPARPSTPSQPVSSRDSHP